MIAKIVCAIIGLLHLYFGFREIKHWRGFARRVLGERATEAFLSETTEMAANQGTYNLFIGAGLILATTGLFANGSKNVALFFLVCVVIAGLVGWKTMKKPVFLVVQTAFALVALVLCLIFWTI